MLSSIKQEKNLPGDRRVRWEVLASPDSLFLSPSVAIYFSWQKNNFGTKVVKHFFCSPADAVRKANNNLQTQLSKSILYCNNNI